MTDSAIGGHVVLPVTIQAGPHLERLSGLRLDFGHGGYITVTDRAGLAYRHGKLAGTTSSQRDIHRTRLALGQKSNVGLVNEPHMVRQPMDPLPIYGITVGESVDHPLNFVQVHIGVSRQLLRIYLLVAEDAGFHRRDGSRRSLGHVSVTKLALDAYPSGFHRPSVHRMGKSYGLRRSVA
jgi:hypothetical protein